MNNSRNTQIRQERQKKGLSLLTTAILSLPKSIYFNLKCFPVRQAVRLPILVHYKTKIRGGYRGCIKLPDNQKFGIIKMGFGGTEQIIPYRYNMLILSKESQMIFHGKANLEEGFSLSNEGILEIGQNFSANRNLKLFCAGHIVIGDDVLLGWDTEIRDMDGHKVINRNEERNVKEDTFPPTENISPTIKIGDKVWIGSYAILMKNTMLPDQSIVGIRSVVNKKFDETNTLIAGIPAEVKAKDKVWIH